MGCWLLKSANYHFGETVEPYPLRSLKGALLLRPGLKFFDSNYGVLRRSLQLNSAQRALIAMREEVPSSVVRLDPSTAGA